jgi:hypothetical protein
MPNSKQLEELVESEVSKINSLRQLRLNLCLCLQREMGKVVERKKKERRGLLGLGNNFIRRRMTDEDRIRYKKELVESEVSKINSLRLLRLNLCLCLQL